MSPQPKSKDKEEILRLLAAEKPDLARRFKVQRLALFGSYARGDQDADSDVDILVEVDPSIGLDFVTLANRIEKALDLTVDVVSSRAVKPRAWRIIEQDLIYV